MQLQMGSCLNRTVHSSLLGCNDLYGMAVPANCVPLESEASEYPDHWQQDTCEQGWVLVQRRRQRCSQGQGKKGKESENKKASFVFSNRAFSVGKKASFHSACPSGDCRGKVSSISSLFVFLRPQAGQVFWLNLVHAISGRCLLLALARSLCASPRCCCWFHFWRSLGCKPLPLWPSAVSGRGQLRALRMISMSGLTVLC